MMYLKSRFLLYGIINALKVCFIKIL